MDAKFVNSLLTFELSLIRDLPLCRGIETGSEDSMSPSSVVIPHRTFTDLNRVRHPQRAREATEYIRHLSIDERFFKGPIAVPKKVIAS